MENGDREIHKAVRNPNKVREFMKEVEGIVMPSADLETGITGRKDLKKRNLEILRKVANGADIKDPEFQAEVGLQYQALLLIVNKNIDVLYQILSGESAEKRAIWRRLEYLKMLSKAKKATFKHDELDVIAEMRKEDQGDAVNAKVTNIGIQVYIFQVATEDNFNDMVNKTIFKKQMASAEVVNS